MARITRFLSLRKQFILNRSNVRFATIQIPDPTKIVDMKDFGFPKANRKLSKKEFIKMKNEFKINNYCTLSPADRRKGTRSNFFFKPIDPNF